MPMDYSLPAWLGALAGTAVAVALYVPLIGTVDRRWRAQAPSQTLEQRAAFEEKLSIVRRVILAVGIAVFATAGYWIGNALAGSSSRF
jgi:hypothetical protein